MVSKYDIGNLEKYGIPPPPGRGVSEDDTQARCQINASELGYALWRNNSGVTTDASRPVRYGLGNISKRVNEKWKSSDLIGVGPAGRFLAVECKHPEWVAPESDRDWAQLRFMDTVWKQGGIGFFITNPDHLEILINRTMLKMPQRVGPGVRRASIVAAGVKVANNHGIEYCTLQTVADHTVPRVSLATAQKTFNQQELWFEIVNHADAHEKMKKRASDLGFV